MTFNERVNALQNIIDDVRWEPSTTGKRDIINDIPSELYDDFEYIVECLAGRYPFGYKWRHVEPVAADLQMQFYNVRQALMFACTNDRSNTMVNYVCAHLVRWEEFFQPIIDRTLKLGIGQSILAPRPTAPMLAKKLEDVPIVNTRDELFVTEKLDGNRCIAWYDLFEGWKFTSRNGKAMNVVFDMEGLPIEYVYDGEILSEEQVNLSKRIYTCVQLNERSDVPVESMFNKTSGIINRKTKDKHLVYNIFDIQCELSYRMRRIILDDIDNHYEFNRNEIRILPVLFKLGKDYRMEHLMNSLDIVTSLGGEGLMINFGDKEYEHKRTNSLLKYKKVKTMDMKVMAVIPGDGKYEMAVGAILCEAQTDDVVYSCSVGSGLSDMQRYQWLAHPEYIVGSIVEVAYFDVSQAAMLHGTKQYSLRFPRLKSVRHDKTETSIY